MHIPAKFFTKLVERLEHQAGKMKSKNKFIPLVGQMSGLASTDTCLFIGVGSKFEA